MTAMRGWPDLRAFALGLDRPGVEDCVSWGDPGLKVHGQLWTGRGAPGRRGRPGVQGEP
ncbi:MAG: hypothetical protein ACOC20_07945 [Oceanicaulis sp.]